MRKVSFFVVKRKYVCLVLAILVGLSAFIALPAISTSTPMLDFTIVIDAGHGGIDGGSVGSITGIDENNLNLKYAKKLEALFEKYNFKVVMTRTNLNGLYDITSPNKKKSDMARRKEIIEQSNANMVISIHMNSFPLKSSRGAQVFYKNGDESSKAFANSIQEVFLQTLSSPRKTTQTGDYFILNCSNIPSVIVECGFLSNAEEEQLLINEHYQNTVCESIFVGVLNFLTKN